MEDQERTEEKSGFHFMVEPGKHGGWTVRLPHQCDSWDIAGDDGWYGVEHAEAVARLTQFIAEARSALDALVAGECWNPSLRPGELPHGE
jgi:hypothetical protein